MKCRKCNFKLPPGEKECPLCGTDCAYVEKKRAQKRIKLGVKRSAEGTPSEKPVISDQTYFTVYLDSENQAKAMFE